MKKFFRTLIAVCLLFAVSGCTKRSADLDTRDLMALASKNVLFIKASGGELTEEKKFSGSEISHFCTFLNSMQKLTPIDDTDEDHPEAISYKIKVSSGTSYDMKVDPRFICVSGQWYDIGEEQAYVVECMKILTLEGVDPFEN